MDRSPTHKNISMAGFVCKGIEFENWCRCINISKISKLGVLFYTRYANFVSFQGRGVLLTGIQYVYSPVAVMFPCLLYVSILGATIFFSFPGGAYSLYYIVYNI